MLILIVIAFIVVSITIDAVIRNNRQKRLKAKVVNEDSFRVFNEASVSIPNGIYFDKTHTWAFMEKTGAVKIGVDDFLLHLTGKINKIKMKEPGEKILKGEPAFSIIQDGKQLVINAPVSGVVKTINKELTNDPGLLNTSTFNEGWVYTIEPSNWIRETQFLFMAETYKEWLKKEFIRVKDFFATVINRNNAEYSPVILQEGGELKENVLKEMNPEVWEEFQKSFINSSK
jgi:glycine cleavage system H lipoate-binding protein